MNKLPDLLELRLNALEQDVIKVAVALDRAQERGQDLEAARKHLRTTQREWRAIKSTLEDLADAMAEEPAVEVALDGAQSHLARELRQVAGGQVADLTKALVALRESLDGAADTAVQLEERHLQSSLERRCASLRESIEELRRRVRRSPQEREEQWDDYQTLLDGEARPIFAEYVDFFAGLTLRDTGLDDRVCEMTDALLSRFRQATRRSLPLPARQAALGVAMHSVVLLGFPEWSIWGVPLVGHEVGLAYVEERRHEPELVDLIDRFAPHHSGLAVRELFADVFATYTGGFAYACAALLLRLSPRHGVVPEPDHPSDIDRARVIRMTLLEIGEGAASYEEAVEHLVTIWFGGVRSQAGPDDADHAVAQAVGPPPEHDWLDDLTGVAISYLRGLRTVVPAFDQERWDASSVWALALHQGDAVASNWEPEKNSVPDVLTAAWRVRLGWTPVAGRGDAVVQEWVHDGSAPRPTAVAEAVKNSWSRHRRTVGR